MRVGSVHTDAAHATQPRAGELNEEHQQGDVRSFYYNEAQSRGGTEDNNDG